MSKPTFIIGCWKHLGILVVCLLIAGLLLATGAVKTASAAANQNFLGAGEWLRAGQALVSANHKYTLELQEDSNLVIYYYSVLGRTAIYNTGTGGNGRGSYLVNQATDGNLVLYRGADGLPLFNAHTNKGQGASTLWLGNDGNLTLWAGPTFIWATNSRYGEPVDRSNIFLVKTAALRLADTYGWTDSTQQNCLLTLWNNESGWRWNADNSSSHAYGIPQSLPATKMASAGGDWHDNPVTQIKWGLSYIRATYGSPCTALSKWYSRSPHWY